ncbi:Histone H2B type 1-P [Crotalus adamanteus]|uniref:Histone H2B type 1-P n=1 Tax=Crotalus adamanteus TaxID=8729 RepID=A0AAW1BX65_CROAD
MAAAHRPRRRTRFPRRKKQTRGRKRTQRKLLPKCRKQHRKQGKQGTMVVRKLGGPQKSGLKRPYDEFISKVLRRLHRDRIPISTKAKGKMISFIRKFYNNVSEKATCSKRAKHNCTIGSKELQNALKKVMHKKQAMDLVQTVRKEPRR